MAKELTATPARIKVVVGTLRPMRARLYTIITVIAAPMKEAAGITYSAARSSGQRMLMAMTAPSPAPEATPIRYGSASGLRNRPW